MNVSLNWLRRYVDVDWDAETIAERLTLSGLEVENIAHLKPEFAGVRVGHVIDVVPHPNADKLRLATIDTGSGTERVVCGAPNCRAGLVVAHAGIGARLAGGVEISQRAIRGVVSAGMLCSEDELGLSTAAAGILELGSDLDAGQSLADVLPIEDYVFDIGVTPNRGDCLGHVGVAREVAALSGAPLCPPVIELPPVAPGEAVPVVIGDADRCARYIGRVIRGLSVAPSPFWLRRLLEAVGVRTINNLVDVTNFVMLELGQPLHAFDLRYLRGRRIEVRCAATGEQLPTLDEEIRTFVSDDLLICDGEGPVAVAGVMGGLGSQVRHDTTDLFLEAAWFRPSSVRLTSRRLGLKTESSYRFERGVDPEGIRRAADRATSLFVAMSGPNSAPVVGAITDARARAVPRTTVSFAPSRTRAVLGMDIPTDEQHLALERLGFDIEAEDDLWKVTAPSWRSDITGAADLVEEVARIRGYDVLPATLPSASSDDTGLERPGNERALRLRAVRRFLTSRGLHQALNYSFLNASWQSHFPDGRALPLINPLSEDQGVLRTTLAARLTANARHNFRHGRRDVALFEIGKVFHAADVEGDLPIEVERLGLILTGERARHWSGTSRVADFYDLKGVVEDLCASIGRSVTNWAPVGDVEWLHPGAAARAQVGTASIGVLGRVHPRVERALELPSPCFVAELDLAPLVDMAAEKPRFVDFARLPAVTRDLSLKVPRRHCAAEVLSAIEELGLESVDKVEIFDVYEGENVGAELRSIGLAISYRAKDRTLTDEEVNETQRALLDHLEACLDAVLR